MTDHHSVILDAFGAPLESDNPDDIVAISEHVLSLEGAVAERPGNTLSYTEKVEMLRALDELERRKDYAGHLRFFPDEGPYSYDKYVKHIQFLAYGATKRERVFMAGNRVGKSIAGGYEMACHLTGMYPHWWTGRRFFTATDCWASGDTGQTTRDIVQAKMLGDNADWGTGMIPRDCIVDVRMRPGGGGAVDLVRVRHTSGQISKLGFKSYDQKRRAFQGTQKHAIWLDEEPPIEVYGECLMRTAKTGEFVGGIVYVTFTPLQGITPFVQEFLNATEIAREIQRDRETGSTE
jgi:phage terminase large subunit-like protein